MKLDGKRRSRAVVACALAAWAVLIGGSSALAEGGLADLIYDAYTGNVKVDASQAADGVVTSFQLETPTGTFIPANYIGPTGGTFGGIYENVTTSVIGDSDLTFTGFSGVHDFGNICPAGLEQAQWQAYLTTAVYTGLPGTGQQQFSLQFIPSPVAELIYDPVTGNVRLDASAGPDGVVTSFQLETPAGTFVPANYIGLTGGTFGGIYENVTASVIGDSDLSFAGFSGVHNFGNIFPAGMDQAQLYSYLTTAVYTGLPGNGQNEIGLTIAPETSDNPNIADLIYDPATGRVWLNAAEAGRGIVTSFQLENGDGTFEPGNYTGPTGGTFGGVFQNVTAAVIGDSDLTFAGFSGTHDFGEIFPAGMDLAQLEAYLTTAVYTGALGTGQYTLDARILVDPGDTDLDGDVDADDYIALKTHMGQASGAGAAEGDFDFDGDVDWYDLQFMLGALAAAGGSTPPATPEPATLFIMMAAGLPALLKRRRRRS